MWGSGSAAGVLVAGIQSQTKAFAFLNHRGILVPIFSAGSRGGAVLGRGVGEEEVVGDILVAAGALLRQILLPPKKLQDGPDQLLLRHGLVGWLPAVGEGRIRRGDFAAESGHRCGCRLPLSGGLDAGGQEVVGEELAGHGTSYTRAAALWKPAIRLVHGTPTGGEPPP